MPPNNSLSGLMKWLAKDPWRDAFLNVLDLHIGIVIDENDVADFDELGSVIDTHWAMILWGCAFEDFLTKKVEGGGNIVEDYLKRRGWKETVRNKDFMSALKSSTMSLYEVSDIETGRSFLARDLIRGGEPVRISEHTATKTLKPWDRLAMRVVQVRGTNFIGGGLLPFDRELSEHFLAAIGSIENQVSAEMPGIIDELGVDRNDSEFKRLMDVASDKAEHFQDLAPAFSLFFLANLLNRKMNLTTPHMTNSDGDEIEFMRVVYRIQKAVTPDQLRAALHQAPDLEVVSENLWQWLEQETTRMVTPRAHESHALKFVTATAKGSVVLGTIELHPSTIDLCVNSEFRANRGRKMLEGLLGGLISGPLVERQTLEQALSDEHQQAKGSLAPELPSEVRSEIIHDAMERHYRAQLDQPIPALGNISPRKASRSKKGREKLIAWLKLLENQTAKHELDHPMASYDFTWMWEDLGVSHLRE